MLLPLVLGSAPHHIFPTTDPQCRGVCWMVHHNEDPLQGPTRSKSHSKLAAFYVTPGMGQTIYLGVDSFVRLQTTDQAISFLLCSEGCKMQRVSFALEGLSLLSPHPDI